MTLKEKKEQAKKALNEARKTWRENMTQENLIKYRERERICKQLGCII